MSTDQQPVWGASVRPLFRTAREPHAMLSGTREPTREEVRRALAHPESMFHHHEPCNCPSCVKVRIAAERWAAMRPATEEEIGRLVVDHCREPRFLNGYRAAERALGVTEE